MMLAALIDAGVDAEAIRRGIASLDLPGVGLSIKTVSKKGFRATAVRVKHPEQHAHRHLRDILELVERASALSDGQRTRARRVFQALAEAEAKVHGRSVDAVHFHEVGAVEAMVVDVQCIFQGLVPVADQFHTELITTSPKVKITGATHIQFDESRALEIAKEIVRRAIDRFPDRKETFIPEIRSPLVPGFSHEYIDYALGGLYRGSLRPLNDAIIAGRIRGVVANIGCNNARICHDELHRYVVTEFIKNDVLVVETGCGAIASAKQGYMTPETALELAGPGLREVCEAVGIPPVLHLGSCVDNSRILTVLAQMATEGGLGEDIADIPAVGMAPEWMSEKALSIATYCVASGAYVILGGSSGPVSGSETVLQMMSEGWEKKVGGRLEFVEEGEEIVRRALAHIDKKRADLGLAEYDPSKWGMSGDWRIPEILGLPLEERIEAVYGKAGK
ncbi:MAG TPA: DUF111 family protein [Anaerolineae bacterium]|nr:DUF111 family protein [Anaerolineae bacterium]